MTDKQRIDQIAVRIAEETDAKYPWNMNDKPWIKYFAHALAASPEFLEAILPDGVEANGYISAFAGKKLKDKSSIMGVEISNHQDKQHPIPIYAASAILAATAPLKAEIAEIKDSMAYRTSLIGRLESELADEQSKVKVLMDAIDAHLNPCGCFNGCEFCNTKMTLEEALANVRGK